MIIKGKGWLGHALNPNPLLLSMVGCQESCNGDMTVLDLCSKSTDHIKQATVHKKHLAYHALIIRGRVG